MKKEFINEVKRMQELAGIITEDNVFISNKKEPINESFLALFALAGAMTAGASWLQKKKKEIAYAEQLKSKEKYSQEEIKTREIEKKAIETATQALNNPKYQTIEDQIKNDSEIKKWMKQLDADHAKSWDEWRQQGINVQYPEPVWGETIKEKEALQKIYNKIKTFNDGEEFLKLIQQSGKNLGNIK
jgi:uncharacterized protein (DUF342 family)